MCFFSVFLLLLLSSVSAPQKPLFFGSKLILAKINWCFVLKPEDYKKNMNNLIRCINIEMKSLQDNPHTSVTTISTHGVDIKLTHGLDLGGSDGYEGSMDPSEKALSVPLEAYTPFWERHFAGRLSVNWQEFREKFLLDYGPMIEEEFQEKAEEQKKFVTNLMFKDIFHATPVIQRSAFEAFCSHRQGTTHRFYRCLQDFLLAYTSLREIISMDSSLRITTIQSLGKIIIICNSYIAPNPTRLAQSSSQFKTRMDVRIST